MLLRRQHITNMEDNRMKQYQSSEKTKRALADALKGLMTVRPFSRITITDIVTECGFNRKTFYYHFEDTISLLHWMLSREAVEVVRSYDLAGDLKAALGFAVGYVRANSHILNCAYDSLGREGLKSFLCSDFRSVVMSYIEARERELSLEAPDDFKTFLTGMYSEAIAGTLLNMFTADDPAGDAGTDDSKTIDYLFSAIDAAIPAALQSAGHFR